MLLQRDHDFDEIETVEPEIVTKVDILSEVAGTYTQLIRDDAAYACADFIHGTPSPEPDHRYRKRPVYALTAFQPWTLVLQLNSSRRFLPSQRWPSERRKNKSIK